MDHVIVQKRAGRRVIPLWELALMGVLVLLLFAALVHQAITLTVSDLDASFSTNPTMQTSEGGQVSVSVTWPGRSGSNSFDVAMNTHSVNLDPYDLSQLVVLRTGDGREGVPLSWDAPLGGHHRSGTLIFSNNGVDGKPLISSNTKGLELTIWEVAGVHQRTFTWTLR